MASLCEAIEQRRNELNISAAEAAKMMGVHPSSLSRSMRAGAFSPVMMRAAYSFIRKPTPERVQGDHDVALRLLQDFLNSATQIKAALEFALDGVQVKAARRKP
ncbi:helix-turn-helix transcriptional regulator [Neorhizobium sp. SHOUNA12A]|uniref:helix-turn-helix domain-containing protein n=1 Tax=Neorhizobium sp. SHOUNA12A TaxID=2908923 RepID=UPI001FF67AE0|nr:helix-turn-helix transcriptional regulator [Neorhizobium sp. SHOUNA12A]MCJ9669466.1 helix-turn-helix domain-containing protein [Neorhizobium sp. SHOUNA12B]